MGIRSALCYELSRKLLPPPMERTVDYRAYEQWRNTALPQSWGAFSDDDVSGKDVIDFGCGDGALSLYLAVSKGPRRITGVDLNSLAIERAEAAKLRTPIPEGVLVEFKVGSESVLPLPSESVDTVIAFDCLEHVMSPLPIFCDWYRVLRPGGKILIEWFPFKGPWGPHMESLIPIPWAHLLFGEAAMFRTAEKIYDLPTFTPRHWDLDESGQKKPNKWRAWSTFKEQGYINELDLAGFRDLVHRSKLQIHRLDVHSFGGSGLRRTLGRLLMGTPLIGEYFISFATIELVKGGPEMQPVV